MTDKINILVIILISLVCISGINARVLTLDDCIEMALANNEDVIRAQNQVKVADGVVWQSFGSFLPSFTVRGTANETHYPKSSSAGLAYDPTVPPYELITTLAELNPQWVDVKTGGTSKSYSIGGDFFWVPFNGGRNIFNYFGSKAGKQYYRHLSESVIQTMIYRVKMNYYNYLKAVDQENIAEESVKRGEEQYKLAKSKYEVGSASKSDVLKAKVQYGNDKLNLITKGNSVRTTKADLLYLIGMNVNDDVEISSEYTRPGYDGTQSDALNFGLVNHPGLMAAKSNLKAAKYDIKSTLGRYLPSLSVSLSKSWNDNTFGGVTGFDKENSQWSISSTVSWAIFENFSKKRDVTRAKVTVNNSKVALKYAENNVALEIKKSYLDIERAREALEVANNNVEAANEDMELVNEKYRLGAATILELLDAQVSLSSAQNQKVEADFAFSLAIAKLEQAMGAR